MAVGVAARRWREGTSHIGARLGGCQRAAGNARQCAACGGTLPAAMSTLFRYTLPVEETHWKFQGQGETSFTWDYDAASEDLLKLYAKGKEQQWDAEKRIDWSIEVDPHDPMQM